LKRAREWIATDTWFPPQSKLSLITASGVQPGMEGESGELFPGVTRETAAGVQLCTRLQQASTSALLVLEVFDLLQPLLGLFLRLVRPAKILARFFRYYLVAFFDFLDHMCPASIIRFSRIRASRKHYSSATRSE
jgi:hypothetical protein